MNYRHSFHAGNFADCLKHFVLAHAMLALMKKDVGIRFIDAFAGRGLYDLGADAALRSPEWQDGIGKIWALDGKLPDPIAVWLKIMRHSAQNCVGATDEAGRDYAGSPAIIATLMRDQDEAIFAELHPEEAEALKYHCGEFERYRIVESDGYQCIKAVLPPPTRRGLILIDPPFERPGEFRRMVQALKDGLERFATGTYLLWYADKAPADTARFIADIKSLGQRALKVSLQVAEKKDGQGLVSTGLILINPPFGLEAVLQSTLSFFVNSLARHENRLGASHQIVRLSGNW